MEGNDFVLFKHGCGNDSSYENFEFRREITPDGKERFDKPCENFTFYHVDLEHIGNQSTTYKYEQPDDDADILEHAEDDVTNPVIFKIRKATISDWFYTASGKEEIWYEQPPKVFLKSDRKEKAGKMRIVTYI